MVLLPDTQFYSEKFPHIYVAQTLWIRERLKADNIKFAIHLGDIVQTPTKEEEWKNAHKAMAIIDGVVPYSMVPGNHDMDATRRDSTLYNKYFSPERFAGRDWYGGHLNEGNDNNFCFFEGGGMKFMVISLAYAPRDKSLDWALATAKRFPDHRVIVATHQYMAPGGRYVRPPKSTTRTGNSGEEMWEKLIRKSPNIFLVVSGHYGGVALQTSTNDAGGKVFEMLTDYQNLKMGGNGWLRTLRFEPAKNKVHVTAYSPVLDETNEDTAHTFTLDYEMHAPVAAAAGN
ncbi:metallophosphoesterase [Lignipirellula cremea]|uniref:metallophosphoesterase n=1 Tax=Lignipirellula cremea TaxID=2528010 RepID=UPI0018D209A0|nr:metallophosphoesterase [Lignipirellula cremea]